MVCLDTSFIVDVLRGDKKLVDIEKYLEEKNEDILVPAPAVSELIKGAYLSDRPEEEKEKVIDFLSKLIVLNFDKDGAIISGKIEAELIKKGMMIDLEDIMIASISMRNDEKLLTTNKKHFDRIEGLRVEVY